MTRALNPQPRTWPECSECHVAYVLRRAMTFRTKPRVTMAERWVWARDCRHKNAPPAVAGIGAEEPTDGG